MFNNHLLFFGSLIGLATFAETGLENLNQVQKQAVESVKGQQQAQRDSDALDLLQGKLKNRAWILSRYPSGAELGSGIKPRLEIRQTRASGVTAYVPTRQVRGKILPGSAQCTAAIEYQVDASACSDVNEIMSCVAGKKAIVGTACTPTGQRGSSEYTVDSSQLGSLEILSQTGLEQSGFVGVRALGLVSSSEASNHFTNASGILDSQAVASVPIQFIKYRTDASYPLLVSGLEVRVGNTLALMPVEAPVPATCSISAVDQVNGGQSVAFTMNGTSVISTAELNGGSISLPAQSSDPGSRVLSTLSLVAPSNPGQLANLVQEANSDYANGQWTISGRVVGPKNDGDFTCSKVVTVRVYNPKAPECALILNPDTQEPDEPVQVTVTANNSVTSAVLNGSIPITFSPVPSAATTGSFSTTRTKNGSGEETYSAVLTGPGGTTTCTKQLFPKVPLPPICQLAANPAQIQNGQSTTLTLTTQNRVDSATVAGRAVTLSARWNGTGSLTYQKTTPNSEQIQAVVSSRGMSSTCTVNLACAPSPAPRCSLAIAPQRVKAGERATVTLSCQDPVASASIAGSPVSLSGGTASISYTKNGLNPESIVAIARGEGTCGTESRPQVNLEAIPPCRFTDTSYVEKMQLNPSRANPVALFKTSPLIEETTVIDRNLKTITTTFKTCKQLPCAGTDCPLNPCDPDSKIKFKVSTATRDSRGDWDRTWTYFDTNGVQTSSTFQENVSNSFFQGILTDVCQTREESNPYMNWGGKFISGSEISRVCTEIKVNGDDFDLNPYQQTGTSLAACTTSNWPNSAGSPFPSYPVCLAPTHAAYNQPYDGSPGQTSYLWSINAQMMPGRFKYYEQSSAANGGIINFDRTCAANSFCILERARPVTYWANNILSSDYYTWVQVGPTDSSACAVTAYQTSPAIRTGGCFTGKTPIMMANGKEKLISEIRENDYVLNPHYGMGVRVRKVVKGPEKKPLYAVMLGHKQIEVTEDHPFFTQRGWVQTLDLKPGDQLFGKGQGQVITKVMRLPYQQPVDVWNFELDTEDPMAHVVVANGIPTGDLVTQLEIKKNKKPLP